MTRSLILVLLFVVGLAATLACEDDPVEQIILHCFDCPIDPTTREAVLYNIEKAHEKRLLDWYEEVLDPNFTFFLSNSDVGGGLPVSWGRSDEITANTNLFSNSPPAQYPRCKRIQIDIQWEGGVVWTEVIPESAPDETWYTTILDYDFKIDVEPDMTYINDPGAKAQFTVRNAGTEDAPQWRLVEMRDLGDDSSVVQGGVASTVSTTWGSVKAIYR